MQMVAISRALLGSPGLVLFDEPSQGLAPKVVQDVMATIARLRQEGVAVLLVEQNVATALAVADRCYVMDRGRIVHEGPAARARRGRGAAHAAARDMTAPLLAVEGLRKQYTRGLLQREVTFSLEADFTIAAPAIVGVMGPNGSGKTTLFELITGSNAPTAGRVRVCGRDIHRVRYRERDRLAIHYHQSYQVRAFRRTRPNFMLEPAGADFPMLHLFDEPQFNTQDGYIGFMLDFFRRLRARRTAGVPVPASHRAVPSRHPARDLRAVRLRAPRAGRAGGELGGRAAGIRGPKLPRRAHSGLMPTDSAVRRQVSI